MVFSSVIFLTVFLPLYLLVYYLSPARWRSLVILIGSYLFYAWWRVDFVLLFGFVTLFNYLVSMRMIRAGSGRSQTKKQVKKRWLIVGVAGNLLVLGYFKYFNFGVDSLNVLLGRAGMETLDVWSVILPIGISFYIFQAISYVIDVYRRDAAPARRFLDFAAFIALFPQLIAGPVIRYKDIAGQFERRTHTLDKFNEGAIRFMTGFCKKVLVADTLAPLADLAFSQPDPTFCEAWLGVLAYTAQLYFDFSGYSHMAIGLGLMMGFRFIENFNHPYISRSITEFWRRWHISLSTWLRDYLYIPLGGNRKGRVRTYLNLLITMVLGGLWHGSNWTFVLWGAWHGLVLAVERMLGAKRENPYPRFLALPLTFFFIVLGWVLFRSPDVATAMQVYAGMFGQNGFALSDNVAWSVTQLQLATLGVAFVIVFILPHCSPYTKDGVGAKGLAKLPLFGQIGLSILMLIAVAKLVAQSYSPFLYFQF